MKNVSFTQNLYKFNFEIFHFRAKLNLILKSFIFAPNLAILARSFGYFNH
jgi:hypothetical protein